MTEVITTTEQLRTSAVAKPNQDVPMSLLTGNGFAQLQRVAKALASSTMVPVQYRDFTEVKQYGKVTGYLENPSGLPNCVVALNMAVRMNADPLMIMQNLHVIEGRPSWSSQFIIAMLNSSGKFSPLRFDLSEEGEEETINYEVTIWNSGNKSTEQRSHTFRHQSCVAWVVEKETGQRLNSPKVTMAMARDEGWIGKKGSKWQTMQEVMLQYRTASLLGRFYAPELLMGLQSQEEVEDFIDATPNSAGEYSVDVNDLRERAAQKPAVNPSADDEELPDVDAEIISESEQVNTETGEITEKPKPKPRTRKPKAEAEPEPESQEEPAQEEQQPEPEVDPAADIKPSRRQFNME